MFAQVFVRVWDAGFRRHSSKRFPLKLYTSLANIDRECLYVEQLCRRHGWNRINATGKAVEEVVRQVIALLPER